MAKIEIDSESGFCFGVVTAIRKAEEELERTGHLYCLGDIVHNSNEVERLESKGLQTITHDELHRLHGVTVLLRAHGEPPETYRTAANNNINIIDATCPVVLQLQRRIHARYNEVLPDGSHPQIVIYGKKGHAEVNGLVGQTDGEAIVVESTDELDRIDFDRDIYLYSQTTKSLDGFAAMVDEISRRRRAGFESFDTICRQVANRIPRIRRFALSHDLILFVCGSKSSNGKILYEECRRANPESYRISSADEINPSWLAGKENIGICGATSTPRWLMEEVRQAAADMVAGQ